MEQVRGIGTGSYRTRTETHPSLCQRLLGTETHRLDSETKALVSKHNVLCCAHPHRDTRQRFLPRKPLAGRCLIMLRKLDLIFGTTSAFLPASTSRAPVGESHADHDRKKPSRH